jgi:beta-galactosidase
VAELGALAARLGEVVGSTVEADVALLWDYQSVWAATGPAMPSSALRPTDVPHTIHRLLRGRGITTDIVHPGSDLSRYRLVVVPTLYLVTDDHAAAIRRAAEGGTHVLVTFFSGISDEHDHARLGGYPGAFRDLLGVRVEEFFPLRPGETVPLDAGAGRLWSEHLTASSAEVVRRYAGGPLTGRPAVTRSVAPADPGRTPAGGSAGVWYLSTLPDDETLADILREVTEAAGVTPAATVPPGVDGVRRRSASGSWLFLVNQTREAQPVPVDGVDLVSGRQVGSDFVVPPGGVAVVREA